MGRVEEAVNMKVSLGAIVLALILCAPLVHAEQGYVGVSAGGSKIEGEIDLVPLEGTDVGFKLFGGYRFTGNFGLEAGYADLGSNDATQDPVTVKAAVAGWTAEAQGVAPVGERFEVFATAGLFLAETEIDSSGDVLPGVGATPRSTTERDVEFTLGVGGAFKFKHLAIRAELEYYSNESLDQVYLFSAGLEYRF